MDRLETSSFTIRILLAPEQNYFNEKRLSRTASNLRWQWFNGDSSETNSADEPFYPTPTYNTSILFDCRLRATSDYLHQLFAGQKELLNGLRLFKIWLEQRQLSQVERSHWLTCPSSKAISRLGSGLLFWRDAVAVLRVSSAHEQDQPADQRLSDVSHCSRSVE